MLLAAFAMGWGPGALDARAQAGVVLSGQVVDQQTGEAIPHVALVVLPGKREVLADAEGRFRVRLRPGDYVVSASHLGYGPRQVVVALAPETTDPVVIALAPEPHVLEAVRVTVNRFDRRRHMVAVSSQVLDRSRLLRSGGHDLWSAIRSYAGLGSPVPCGRDRFGWATSGDGCINRRGQATAPRFYIDDRIAFAGADELAGYSTGDIHHVEVYARGEMIRVYTMGFVERVARGEQRLFSSLH
jgi:hypothetical protein